MNDKTFAYLDIEKHDVWQLTQANQDLPTPPRNIHIIKDDPESEFVTIQWGTGQSRIVPRFTIYYANRFAQAITDRLVELAGESENCARVVDFFVVDMPPVTYAGTLYYTPKPDPLSWQECPPYVLGAVLSIGMFLDVPEDVLMSDELLPAIAKILRGNDDE